MVWNWFSVVVPRLANKRRAPKQKGRALEDLVDVNDMLDRMRDDIEKNKRRVTGVFKAMDKNGNGQIERNELGDGFITSFVALLDEGGLAGVEKLVLSRNAISEQGMQELAAAVTRGGLPSCTILYLDNNPGSGKRGYRKVGEALKQRKK